MVPSRPRPSLTLGDRIRLVRTRQHLSMHRIAAFGGPSVSYQSEVETGKKADVSSDILQKWAQILGVTVELLKGEIPQYNADPDACRGLADDILLRLTAAGSPDWSPLSSHERARRLLEITSRHAKRLPRGNLAWTLGLEPVTLDEMILGSRPVSRAVIDALLCLTLIPREFLQSGRFPADLSYATMASLAEQRGVPISVLLQVIMRWPQPLPTGEMEDRGSDLV